MSEAYQPEILKHFQRSQKNRQIRHSSIDKTILKDYIRNLEMKGNRIFPAD
jgi:hypothetical protein